MTEKLDDCLFCTRQQWVLWRGQSSFVQLDDAPLLEGHLLVCPEEHYESMGDVPAESLPEFEQTFECLREIYVEQYGAFALFEHGRTGHCVIRTPADRVCHHAHVHVLPLAGDLTTRVGIGQRQSLDSWSEVRALSEDVDGYLIVDSIESGCFFYPVTRPLPAHYLRTLTADLLGTPDIADWEFEIGSPRSTELTRSAHRRLSSALAELLSQSPGPARQGQRCLTPSVGRLPTAPISRTPHPQRGRRNP
jgi:diadenosine tetraphosphate (Ap4A) HIT family hydrolase